MIHQFRYIGIIVVLFLGCVLGICSSVIYAQSDRERIRLSDDVEVMQLTEGVWLHTTYFDIDRYENVPANGLVVIDSEHAMMIDLPWTDEQTGILFDWVAKEHKMVVEKIVPTHSHIDCAGGLAEAHRRKAESFTLDKTADILKRTNKPVPQNWFTDRLSLACGGIRVELAYFGPGHTIDNIVAWIPAKKILFGGDLVRTENAGNLGNTAEADVESWPKTLKKVQEAYPEVKIVVPGHGQPGGMELIDHTIGLCHNDG